MLSLQLVLVLILYSLVKNKHLHCIYKFSRETQSYILIKISVLTLLLKYPLNFTNFRLGILIKYILIKKECSTIFNFYIQLHFVEYKYRRKRVQK